MEILPNRSPGTQPTLIVREGFNTYLQFNLAALPAGASVSKATLRLFVDSVPANGSFDMYPVESGWKAKTHSIKRSAVAGCIGDRRSSHCADFLQCE